MKNKYGISLIVLIVTIIVMIIIAGAIIMTLSGTGIIDKAENGVDLHNQAVEREQIIMALSRYQLQKNTKDNPQTLLAIMQDELNKDAMVAGPANGPITVVFNRTQNKYVVYENGDIVGPTKAVDAALEEYILGPTREGVDFNQIFDGQNFKGTDLDIEFVSNSVNFTNIANGQYGENVYIKYNDNEYYKFNVNMSFDSAQPFTDPIYGVQFIGKLDGTNKIGQQVEYAGMLWTVLYDDNEHGLQLIANDALTDLTGSKIAIDADNMSEAITSFNSSITTLNLACINKIPAAPGVIKNIRSVGSNSTNPTYENKTLFSSSNFDTIEGVVDGFDSDVLNGKLYSTDNNYISDLDQLIITNLIVPDNADNKDKKDYWFASRYMYFFNDPDTGTSFTCGIFFKEESYLNLNRIISLSAEDNDISIGGASKYIRPVITLEDDIINRLEGSGTTTEPYNLDKYYESIVIVTETASSIPNGTYYNFGLSDQTTKLVIDDSNNQFCYEGVCNDATVTINNGTVTVDTVIKNIDLTFNGNYYETKQNKILTLGLGDFGTTEHAGSGSKNGRLGFLMAINNKDLKHDIEGTYSPKGNGGGFALVFTKNTLYAHFSFSSNPDAGDFAYAGFKDMFYINDCQILYTGLENGFGWQDPQSSGVYYKVKD